MSERESECASSSYIKAAGVWLQLHVPQGSKWIAAVAKNALHRFISFGGILYVISIIACWQRHKSGPAPVALIARETFLASDLINCKLNGPRPTDYAGSFFLCSPIWQLRSCEHTMLHKSRSLVTNFVDTSAGTLTVGPCRAIPCRAVPCSAWPWPKETAYCLQSVNGRWSKTAKAVQTVKCYTQKSYKKYKSQVVQHSRRRCKNLAVPQNSKQHQERQQ